MGSGVSACRLTATLAAMGLSWGLAAPCTAKEPPAASSLRRQDPRQLIFSYVNRRGRRVYVNDPSRVPPKYRALAREVDLSRISTNRRLGRQLSEALAVERQALLGSPRCRDARVRQRRGLFSVAWHRYGHLVLLGGGLLLLLLLTPWMSRTYGAPRWAKVLMVALPLLGMLALWSTVLIRASQVRQRIVRAALLCTPLGTASKTPAQKVWRSKST